MTGSWEEAVSIAPFNIQVPDEVLADLKHRLAHTRFPHPLQAAGWEGGTDAEYLRELVAYWRDRYDWRAAERALNRFPQFRAEVKGRGIHFVHQPGAGPNPLPLILTHGWPSTFWEFHKVIAPLADPAAQGGDPRDAFHVVVPSLPGFGFSDRPRRAGTNATRIAALRAELMGRLGYERFGARGGDWGARLVGVHL